MNLLQNGYSVDLRKVTDSLLQGTLQVIFDVLQLPLTNHGYFWSEEDFGQPFDIFHDCFSNDLSKSASVQGDSNALQLDSLSEEESEEVEMGPAPPPLPTFSTEVKGRPVGPMLPDGIINSLSLL